MKFNAYVKEEFKDCTQDIAETYKSQGVTIITIIRDHGIITGETHDLKIDDLKNSAIVFVEELSEFDPSQFEWFPNDTLTKPTQSGYYFVKYEDGTFDEKPYRIRNGREGFLSTKTITHWASIPEDYDGNAVEID